MSANGKRKILMVLFVISVCFNVFFVAGYLRTRSALARVRTVEGRIELIADRLDLNKAQREKVSDLVTEMWAKQSEARKKNAGVINEFWAETVRDNPDADKIHAFLEGTSVWVMESMRANVDSLLKIMRELSPEQRQALAQIIREKSLRQDEFAQSSK